MAGQRRKTRTKKPTNAPAIMVACAKTIRLNLGVIEVAGPRASFAKIRGATKIRILFFYPSTVGYSPAEENRRSEKLHLALNVSRQKGAGLSPAPHCEESGGLRGDGRRLILSFSKLV